MAKKTTKTPKTKKAPASLDNSWEVRCGYNLQTHEADQFICLFSFLFVGTITEAQAYVDKHRDEIFSIVDEKNSDQPDHAVLELDGEFDTEYVNLGKRYKQLADNAVTLLDTIIEMQTNE